MQKLRIQSTWNKETNSFDRDKFELRESDKVISGKVSISSKKGETWLSKPLPFVAFKSQIDEGTINALLHSNGKTFEAEFGLMVDSFEAEDNGVKKEIRYFKLIINKAVGEMSETDKAFKQAEDNLVGEELDDDFPSF